MCLRLKRDKEIVKHIVIIYNSIVHKCGCSIFRYLMSTLQATFAA